MASKCAAAAYTVVFFSSSSSWSRVSPPIGRVTFKVAGKYPKAANRRTMGALERCLRRVKPSAAAVDGWLNAGLWVRDQTGRCLAPGP